MYVSFRNDGNVIEKGGKRIDDNNRQDFPQTTS